MLNQLTTIEEVYNEWAKYLMWEEYRIEGNHSTKYKYKYKYSIPYLKIIYNQGEIMISISCCY